MKIKDWINSERPREKLSKYGASTLTESELIAILIGTGTKKENAIDLSQRILNEVGGVSRMAKASLDELMLVKGIGPAKAITVNAAFELARRTHTHDNPITITSSKNAADHFIPRLSDLPHEEFWVLFLNRANKPIKELNISKGGVTGTVVDIKIIAKSALNVLSSGVILFHNHPSGNLRPSNHDLQITNRLSKALGYFDIKLLDHIIIGNKAYYSFADEGDL